MSEQLSLLEQMYVASDGTNRFKVFEDGTPDPTKYHDITAVSLLGSGVNLAHCVPGSHGFSGLRGVIIPRADVNGRSQGFDPYAPQRCFIDPELTNKQICIDFSKLDSEMINQAFKQASKDAPSSVEDRGVLTYLNMAQAIKRVEAAKPAAAPPTPLATVTQAVTSFGQVFPQPSAPPSQQQVQPPIQPPVQPASAPVRAVVQSVPQSIMDDVKSPVRKTPMPTPVPQQAARPLRKVLVELPKPIGYITAFYHDVVRTENMLVLVADHNAGGLQHLWFPAAPDTELDASGNIPEPVPLGILVYDEADQPDTGFIVFATGAKFTYNNLEFCLLAIQKEKSYKENHNVAPTQPG